MEGQPLKSRGGGSTGCSSLSCSQQRRFALRIARPATMHSARLNAGQYKNAEYKQPAAEMLRSK